MNAYLTRKPGLISASWLTGLLFCMSLLFTVAGQAAVLTAVNVTNDGSQGTLSLDFDAKPDYKLFPLHDPERLVIDIRQSQKITGLPMKLNNGLIKVVRESKAPDAQHQRIVLELAEKNSVRDAVVNKGGQSQLIITLTGKNGYSSPASAPVSSTAGAQPR